MSVRCSFFRFSGRSSPRPPGNGVVVGRDIVVAIVFLRSVHRSEGDVSVDTRLVEMRETGSKVAGDLLPSRRCTDVHLHILISTFDLHIDTHHTLVAMVLRLRLSRVSTPGGARRHKPFYNIVLAQARSARDSKPMEVLGTYNPIPQTPVGAEPGDQKVKDIKIDVSRAKYWLGVGAQPSDTVWRLLSMVGERGCGG